MRMRKTATSNILHNMGSIEVDLPRCGMFEVGWLIFGSASKPLGKEHAEISILCQLDSANVTTDQVATAWRGLGIEYSNLRSVPVGQISPDLRKKYVEVEEWSRTTFVQSNSKAADLMIKIPARDLPGLWFLPASNEILFVAQHWRTDGIGALMLMNRLLEILAAGHSTHTEAPNGEPMVLEDASGSDGFDDVSHQKIGIDKAVAFHDVMFKRGNLPFDGDETTLPGTIGQYGVILSKASTTAIIQHCKKQGITVTAATNYALAKMIFATSTAEDVQDECRTMISTDPRPHLIPPNNSSASACNVYVLGSVGVVQRNATFQEAASATTAQLKNWYTKEFSRSIRWFLASISTTPPATPPSGVYLSNLGKIDQHIKEDYGSFQVKKFHLGVATMTRQMTFHVWTFRGQMVLSLNYNCEYHALSAVKQRLQIIQDELAHGLGITIESVDAMIIGDTAHLG